MISWFVQILTNTPFIVYFRRRQSMHRKSILILGVLGFTLLVFSLVLAPSQTALAEDGDTPTIDHSLFPALQTEFATASEVTAVCLTCHVTEAQEVMATTHWTWEYTTPDGEELGKINVINNYCVAVSSNYPRCTSCHVGYGWKNAEFDFSVEQNVDCLVCHEQTGTYKKFPTGAGDPVYEEKEFGGKTWSPPDLTAVAQSVANPTRANCGSCHFNGGGAPGVKHGDLDPAMYNPTLELDVHMSPDGQDFTCQTCHMTEEHAIQGSHYEYNMSCESCHTGEAAPHQEQEALQSHTEHVACQTCHIPTFAREYPTKTYWSWETAGDKERNVEKTEVLGVEVDTYHFKKGEFIWEANLIPEYMWFNGQLDWVTAGEVVEAGDAPVALNTFLGARAEEGSKIFPFKAMYGRQPYDTANNMVAVPHLFPAGPDDDSAYWKAWDWDKAVAAGQQSVGVEGAVAGWVDTVMYWPITHQVGPAVTALTCTDCHADDGRLDFAALGYTEEEVAMLSVFPPAVEEEVEEAEEAETEETEETEVEETEAEETEAEEAEEAEEAAAEEPAEEEAAAQSNFMIWIIIGAVVVVVVVVVVLTRRKK
jgi:octaheme c-type cytochrome (tetrathionate reductase family)